jgi:DNA replication and repair protein RecF
MHLHSLQLHHFKNYTTAKHEFSEHLNLVSGPNGTGKTNLLDAIHYLCNTKSAFFSSDSLAIKHEQDFFRIEGHFQEVEHTIKVECICQKENGKTFFIEGKAPSKLSSYIGRFPVVLVSPYDTDLIREGSDSRRKFFDLVLSQSSFEYLDKLMTYNRLLKQRNAALKQMAETGKVNNSLLLVYDEQLIPLNHFISEVRDAFIKKFIPLVENTYQKLAELNEKPQIKYRSIVLETNFENHFYENQRNDIAAHRTILGIHSDDYEFNFNNSSLKRYGSQGQQKTFVLALKLAHFEFVLDTKNKKPILLLDDIFDRLDTQRVTNLSKMINNKYFGQVFITDTSLSRTNQLFLNNTEKVVSINTTN